MLPYTPGAETQSCLIPVVTMYMSGAAADPLKLRAPVFTNVLITKVEGLTDKRCPSIHPVETSLTADFKVRVGRHVGRWPVPLSPNDQFTARLADQ